MIQDLAPKRFHNQYSAQQPRGTDYAVFVKSDSVLVQRTESGIAFLRIGELAKAPKEWIYLFSIDEEAYFLILDEMPPELANAPTYQQPPRDDLTGPALFQNWAFRAAEPQHTAYAGVVALQLGQWYAKNRFCGGCGTTMTRDEKERALRCPHCGSSVYPTLSPAVIVAVIDKKTDRILLSRYAGRTTKRYALIAGFAEVGETIEETVHREVMEEVGLSVKNLRYYKSQPWPFTSTLLMGFYCELDGNSEIHVDGVELAEAAWLGRDEITFGADHISLTNEMIMRFRDKKEEEPLF